MPNFENMPNFDTYLQIEGVDGESLNEKHKDWIELVGFKHDMAQPTSQTRSSAGGAPTGRTVHGDLVIYKHVDKASPKLYEAVSSGKPFKKVKLEVCRSGGSQLKFYEIALEQVLISKVEIQSHGNGQSADAKDNLPVEAVALNYGTIEWTYTQQKREDGTGGGNVTAKYDLTAGKS